MVRGTKRVGREQHSAIAGKAGDPVGAGAFGGFDKARIMQDGGEPPRDTDPRALIWRIRRSIAT
jgi:hypothetical protein